MATNTKIKRDIQSLVINSPKVSLYTLDATALGGTIYNFTTETDGGVALVFNGVTYLPLPVSITGMEMSGEGRMPRPTMTVSNVTKTFLGLVAASKGAVGAKLTRTQTLAKYLDGASEADTSAMFAQDVFFIEQLKERSKSGIVWELVSPLDFGNQQIPKNQVIGYCQRRYRVYVDGAMDYTNASCRYNRTNYFTRDGVPTTIENDVCGKKLSDCEMRFSVAGEEIPFYGCPGVGQIARAYR